MQNSLKSLGSACRYEELADANAFEAHVISLLALASEVGRGVAMTRLTCILALALSACVTSSKTEHLTYDPNIAVVAEPQTQIVRVIQANRGTAKSVEVQFEDDHFTARSKVEGGSMLQTLTYARVGQIEIVSQTNNDAKVFGVLVADSRFQPFFQWGVGTYDDAKALADAISVMTQSKRKPPAAP